MLHESSRDDGDVVRFRLDSWEAAKGVFKSFWFGIFCLCFSRTDGNSFEGIFSEIVKNSKFDNCHATLFIDIDNCHFSNAGCG